MSTYFVPEAGSPWVEKLMAVLKNDIEPEIVPLKVENYAKKDSCFPNVEEKVKRDGGRAYYGWAVWQSANLIESEMHAVWASLEDELFDITPKDLDISHILFIPDESFIYKGQFTDNVRLNITSNRLVDHFIGICNTLGYLYSLGTRVSDTHIELPVFVQTAINDYETLKSGYLILLEQSGNISSPCFCGGQKVYKNCHGKDFDKDLKNNLSKINLFYKNNIRGNGQILK